MIAFDKLVDYKSDFKVDTGKFRVLPSQSTVEEVAKKLESLNHKATIVKDEAAALALIKTLIPNGASVMNAGSVSLSEIGWIDYLKGSHPWKNLHHDILEEKDPAKQAELRRHSMSADYFVSSVSAVSKDGAIYVCDASGSRVGGFSFAAKNIILVVGTHKIVENDKDGHSRVWDFCLPSESVRAHVAYKVPGSQVQNMLRIANSNVPGRIHVIFVPKMLGY
ncbi:hypothetical protein SAMD00019534_093970 [Acytostelium subglobosum LB1]|uniref:hypothetical protein n=1 Tax=Acytostelium subglobosum LB1 TaxID=1410327 RepID=UPI000644DD01|nr:hypothetical protein SAMD00019534_093970 [Acytostelium subglobosum LB1]GAM26222.1 hypothetical protein SAMD00019534_093970 [Acytostelium subglobosum LB1]|eukprot:XP_012750776.1 hypothetical protein SAMD00019534_093970 [Acytostelium subglobosum LB1]